MCPLPGSLDDDLTWFATHVPLGSAVEAKDTEGTWCLAAVVGEAADAGCLRRFVRVRYSGWDSLADDWVSVCSGLVVPLGTHLLKGVGAGRERGS